MKLLKIFIFLIFPLASFAQHESEIISPIGGNPMLYSKPKTIAKSSHNIDSTFIYFIDTLEVPLFDDFSTDKFLPYNSGYTDGNVTSQWYFALMNSTNTIPQNPSLIWCDSTRARIDTVSIVGGIPTTTSDYFPTVQQVFVNDMGVYPVEGVLMNLYNECYVLIDSIIDGVPDPDQDTIYYTSNPHFVQDSAHVFFVDYNDPNTIWVDKFAFHNYSFAFEPWSLGVATFDGVDENGMPYHFGNLSAHEPADVLTSRPINLAGKTNVYLTFIYQAQGHGDDPELNDSLILDFWVVDSNRWITSGWYVLGDVAPNQWDTVHWAIPTSLLDDGFRFRFRNWATTSGALDHWHIDYVLLKDNDLPTVSNFSDLAISEPITSFLHDYTVVPWDHFKNADANSKMLDTLKVKVYNSDLTPTNYANGQLIISFGGVPQAGSPYTLANPAITSEWTGNWELGMNKYPYLLANNYTFNDGVTTAPQAAFDIKLSVDAAVGVSNSHLENDTTYFVQDFRNYYAYDDGSAEAAYGITGSQTLLAIKFEAYEADTLTGVLMHFVPSVYDHSDELFLLTIWDDNNGQPGNIIYQDDYFNTNSPEYSWTMNGFRYYTFIGDQYVVVPETFYVGWQQLNDVSLNIGLDKNTSNGDKIFRNVMGLWQTSSFNASVMIRPVFSTGLNYTLNEDEVVVESASVSIYPNPVSEILNISTDMEFYNVSIFDLTGRLILAEKNPKEMYLSELNSGAYLVVITDSIGEVVHTSKLIKE